MASDSLDMLFFPFPFPSHMLPMLDMAKLFHAHGASVTFLTSPVNAAIIRPTIPNSIRLHTIPFPYAEFGIPEGCDNGSALLPDSLLSAFNKAIRSLRCPFDAALADLRPHCVVSDMFFPWTYHVAAARGIPRLVFHGVSYFARCAEEAFKRGGCTALLDQAGDSVVIPGLPHRIELLKSQVLDINKLTGTPMEFMIELLKEVGEVEPKNYGAVMNTFYELEPDYADYRREVLQLKSWHVGPVSFCNSTVEEKSGRGFVEQPPASATTEIIKWLDEKPPGSVVYTCFGSLARFTSEQLREMAAGFETSGHPFIWVVRNEGDGWIPAEYEERNKGRGMVIRGWAPQLLILSHEAVGGFVTHCGWNSSLEAITAGLPVVTWPLFAEQFYNERLLIEVLKIGVAVGSKAFTTGLEGRPVVTAAEVVTAVRSVMGGGEEAEERRSRVRRLAEMARKAVEEGGSSYAEVRKLMEELKRLREEKQA